MVKNFKVQGPEKVEHKFLSTMFVLFDSIVTKEIPNSTEELRDSQIKNGYEDSLPDEFEHFIGRQYVFIIKVDDYFNLKKGSRSYTGCKMTDKT